MKQATIKTFQYTAADTAAHPLTAISTLASSVVMWAEDGSGDIRWGDAVNQFGKCPYETPHRGDMKPVYDLSQIFIKLSANTDVLTVAYTLCS